MVSAKQRNKGDIRSYMIVTLSVYILGCVFSSLSNPSDSKNTYNQTTWTHWFIASAHAKSELDPYPIMGSVSTRVSMNHSLLTKPVPSEANTKYGIPEADGFGWSTLSLNTNISHVWQFNPKLPPIFFSGSIGFVRALSEGFNRAGAIAPATTQPQQFYVQDLNLSAGWTIPNVDKLIPKLIANWGVGATVPFSLLSQAQGVKTYLSSFLSLVYPTSFKLVIQGTGFAGYNVMDNPTQQIDCTISPDACRISGEDLGNPNALMFWGGVINLQYPIYGGLRFGAVYRMFGSLSAAKFPEISSDPYASPYAQSNNQLGALIHGTTFSLIFGFNRTASAAQQALNESLEGDQQEDEESFLNRLSINLSMTTNSRFYSADNSRVTVPVFDLETENLSRTIYALSVLIML